MARYNDYEEIRVLGSGAFGETWLIREKASGKNFVWKKVFSTRVKYLTDQQKQMANHEVKTMLALSSPYIVNYITSFQRKNKFYIVLEYCDKGDLRKYIDNLKQMTEMGVILSEDKYWELVTQLTIALNHLHTKGVLHRDLKSENIFLANQYSVKLGDFGISKQTDINDQNMAQSVVGTFYTMAPELWKNLKYSEKADLFSLGVILYELVTLNRPFQGRNAFSIGRQICDDDPEPIDNKSHFSDQAKNLIFQLLDKNPDNRPSTNDILQIDQVKLKIVLHQKVQDEITKHDDEIKLRQIELFRQKQKRIFEKEQREMEKAEKKKQNKIKQIEKKQEQDQQKKIDKQTKEDQKEDNEEEEDDEEEDDDDSSDDDDEYDQIQYTPFPFYFASEGRIDVRVDTIAIKQRNENTGQPSKISKFIFGSHSSTNLKSASYDSHQPIQSSSSSSSLFNSRSNQRVESSSQSIFKPLNGLFNSFKSIFGIETKRDANKRDQEDRNNENVQQEQETNINLQKIKEKDNDEQITSGQREKEQIQSPSKQSSLTQQQNISTHINQLQLFALEHPTPQAPRLQRVEQKIEETNQVRRITPVNSALRITSLTGRYCTISINPAIDNDIITYSVQFGNTGNSSFAIGLAKAQIQFAPGQNPKIYDKDCIRFFNSGKVVLNKNSSTGNSPIASESVVDLEIDLRLSQEKRTAHLYVNNEQQLVYCSGIPPTAVRVFGFVTSCDSTITVLSVKSGNKQRFRKMANEVEIKWDQ